MEKIVFLLLIMLNAAYCGFKQTDFLRTRIKKRDFVANVFTNEFCNQHNWKNIIHDRVLSASWTKSSDGTETGYMLSRYSSSIRTISTNISFSDIFYNDKNAEGLKDFRINSRGDIALFSPKEDFAEIQIRKSNALNVISKKIAIRGALAGFGFLDDWVSGNELHLIYTLTTDGSLSVFSIDESVPNELKFRKRISSSRRMISGAYSDGKSDANGKFTIFSWGAYNNGDICKISLDLSNKEIYETILKISDSKIKTENTYSNTPSPAAIADLIQFWVGSGEMDYRLLLRMTNNNFISVDADGVIIEYPILTSVNGSYYNSTPLTVGEIGSVSTCNNRKTWSTCSDLLLFEDFSKSGQGIRRMSWIPDGYTYNLPIEVYSKDVSNESNISKPMIYLRNKSSWKTASGIKVRIWHSRSEMPEQSVKSDLYYSNIPGVTVVDGIENENGNITYTDIIFPDDFDLEPGQVTGKDGLQLGIHFRGYYPGIWDKSNDWSSINQSAVDYSLNQNITVYVKDDNGKYGQVFGIAPPANYVAKPIYYQSNDLKISDNLALWSYPSPLILSSIHTQGNYGISAPAIGYGTMTSMPIHFDADFSPASISMDILVPIVQKNPYWLGNISFSIDIPNANINNAWIGNSNFTNDMMGKFTTMKFALPSQIADQIRNKPGYFKLHINLNQNPGSDPVVIDNIVFQ